MHMFFSIKTHMHINMSRMKTTTYIHENILNITKKCYTCTCIIFISLWDLSRQLHGYPFVYTFLTLWGLPRGSEISQLTPSKELFFITSLTFYLQHWGLALTELSVCVMLETCSILIVSYAFLSHLCPCFMLHTQTLYIFISWSCF
jgi:hypothetical protein